MTPGSPATSTGLLTDRYELMMLDAALPSGLAEHRAVFEVFPRRLPAGRRFGVVAGQGRLSALLPALRMGAAELAALEGVVSDRALSWLEGRTPRFDVSSYAEGETFVPASPVLTVEGTFGEGLLLETLVLSVLNADSAVASAAARMVLAAGDRPLIDMGSRRTHEQAAVSAARAAYVAGFASTSNLEAARRHGLPTTGTAAHAFMLAHRTEREAFTAQVAAQGPGTTILVDTYDTATGIRTAVEVAGRQLAGIRLDSGDPREEAAKARALLDELGATSTQIVVTGDLDEHRIAELAESPVERYGAGTALVTGSGAPTVGFVYKLVAVADEPGPDAQLRPVAKRSVGKASVGGRKWAYRLRDDEGHACGEVLRLEPGSAPEGSRPLQVPLLRAGRAVGGDDVAAAREHCVRALAELPAAARELSPGDPAWTAALGDA